MRSSLTGWSLRTLGPLRYPVFRRFWSAAVASNVGSMVQLVAATWLVSALTGDAQTVALVQTATTLPPMLFALLAGACADVFDRRLILLCSQAAMGLAAFAIAAMAFADLATPWVILAVTFFIASGQAFYSPAWQASVREQVPRDMLEAASSLNNIGLNAARSVGPAIGGALVGLFGASVAFAVNALSFVVVILAIVAWKRPAPQHHLPPERLRTAVVTGLHYARLSPPLLRIIVRSAAFGLSGSGIWALTPMLVREVLHGGPEEYGILLGAFGAGAVGGALARSFLLRWGRNRLINGCSLAFGICSIALGGNSSLALAIPLMAVCGGSWMLCLTLLSVSVQLLTPNWVAGRAISINQMAVFAGMAAGSAMWGTVARDAGVPVAIWTAGGLMIATLLLHYRFAVAENVSPDLRPVRQRPLDSPDAHLGAEAGAVIVMVEYRVPTEATEAFLDRMAELGRIRQRDGARHWSLARDVEQEALWMERFQTATWLEHVRRQVRLTVADEQVRRAVVDLVGEPVRVRRLIEHGGTGRGAVPTPIQPHF